jgi:hypothetical protein
VASRRHNAPAGQGGFGDGAPKRGGTRGRRILWARRGVPVRGRSVEVDDALGEALNDEESLRIVLQQEGVEVAPTT